MKEMIYNRDIREVLDQGTIDGFDYLIVNYGFHPCAYVRVPEEHPYYNLDYMDMDVHCHGGLTFGGMTFTRPFLTKELHGYWIGWDYAHFRDYSASMEHLPDNAELKRWTTAEILDEVKNVIKQLQVVTNNA